MTSEKTFTLNPKELKVLTRKGYKVDDRSLSCGAYATVFKARASADNSRCAVKVIDCAKVSEDYRLKFLPRELYALSHLNHPFIPRMYDIFLVNNRMFVVLELAEGGDLLDVINDYRKAKEFMPDKKARVLFRQVCEALHFIHTSGFAHRDIKCENILLNGTKTVAKLTDFGFARTCYDNSTGRRLLTMTQCGTIGYASPELLSGDPFDAMLSDNWSMGIVLYVMATNRLPFNTRHIRSRQLKKKYKLDDQKQIHSDCKDLISKLLEPIVKDRLKMETVLTHKWIKNVKT